MRVEFLGRVGVHTPDLLQGISRLLGCLDVDIHAVSSITVVVTD